MTGPLVRTPHADPDVAALVAQVVGEHARAVRGRLRAAEPTLDRELWSRLTETGLADLTLPEHAGGSGATWLESAVLLRATAAASVHVPVVMHDLLAGWLLDAAGLATPGDGLVRVAARPDPSGVAPNVAWARVADEVVTLWEDEDHWRVAKVPAAQVHVEPHRNHAGEPSDTLRVAHDLLEAGVPVPRGVGDQFHWRGALARSIQVVGAMERIIEMLIEHVGTREQFGRPIGRFQAVQHRLASLASETALASTAVDAAVAHVAIEGWDERGTLFHVAVAKSVAWHAASEVVRGSHQLFGAIGVTLEHELGALTLPILARRSEFGSIHEWDATLTRLAVAAGSDGLWPLVLTGRHRLGPAAR